MALTIKILFRTDKLEKNWSIIGFLFISVRKILLYATALLNCESRKFEFSQDNTMEHSTNAQVAVGRYKVMDRAINLI